MIRRAVAQDADQLIEIWQVCFGDDREYIQSFLDRCFDNCVALVWEEDGQVQAMVYLLPFLLQPDSQPVYYLYAAATHPKVQGQGIMGKLLQAAKEQGRPIFLKPGSKSLFDYYARNGFYVGTGCRYVQLQGTDSSAKQMTTWQQLKEARRQFILTPYLEPEDNLYPHFFAEWAEQGGKFACTPRGYAVYHPQEKIVKEAFFDSDLPAFGQYRACLAGTDPCTMAWPQDFAQKLGSCWAGMLLD